MDQYLPAVKKVTDGKDGLIEAIKSPELAWLLETSSCERCVSFVNEYEPADNSQVTDDRERYFGGCLLLILAAKRLKDEDDSDACEDGDSDSLEALRLMGAKRVDVLGMSAAKRRGVAARGRKKSVSPRTYLRSGYYTRMQQNIADQLYLLITREEALHQALAQHGKESMVKHLSPFGH
jgi:hypothetical protein